MTELFCAGAAEEGAGVVGWGSGDEAGQAVGELFDVA